MNQLISDFLRVNSIKYSLYQHPPVYTVEESSLLCKDVPGMGTKSLFLKAPIRYYLVCLPGKKRLNIRSLKLFLKEKDIKFASFQELKSELNQFPGGVSPFGMLSSSNTILIIDEEIWNASEVAFHPDTNTESIVLSKENLHNLINFLPCKHIILNL